MTEYALDCAFSYPSPVAAYNLGYRVFIRYFARVSSQTSPKLWTPSQIAECHAAGLAVAGVFEQQANDPLLGKQRGMDDCRIAESQWESLGGPNGTVVGYAYDFDPEPMQVIPYAEGVKEASSGRWPILAYCSDAVAVELFKRKFIDYFWQTESSGFGGTWPSPRAHLIQHTWYDLRPKLNADYDENVLHPEVGIVPWWMPTQPTKNEEEVVTILPGTFALIPVRGPGTLRIVADSPGVVRIAIGPNNGPHVEDAVPVPHFTQITRKLSKETVVRVDNESTTAAVGVTIDY